MKVQVDRSPLLSAGAIIAGLGVALGAFGAHGLRGLLDATELDWWRTAVSYQIWHGLALVAIGAARVPRTAAAAWLLGIGSLVFSATLYLLALTGARWLGAITPVGGLLMLAGWALLAWRGWRG